MMQVRVRAMLRKWIWAKTQATIWKTESSYDQLKQIIARLEMNLTPDNKAALVVARNLLGTIEKWRSK